MCNSRTGPSIGRETEAELQADETILKGVGELVLLIAELLVFNKNMEKLQRFVSQCRDDLELIWENASLHTQPDCHKLTEIWAPRSLESLARDSRRPYVDQDLFSRGMIELVLWPAIRYVDSYLDTVTDLLYGMPELDVNFAIAVWEYPGPSEKTVYVTPSRIQGIIADFKNAIALKVSKCKIQSALTEDITQGILNDIASGDSSRVDILDPWEGKEEAGIEELGEDKDGKVDDAIEYEMALFEEAINLREYLKGSMMEKVRALLEENSMDFQNTKRTADLDQIRRELGQEYYCLFGPMIRCFERSFERLKTSLEQD